MIPTPIPDVQELAFPVTSRYVVGFGDPTEVRAVEVGYTPTPNAPTHPEGIHMVRVLPSKEELEALNTGKPIYIVFNSPRIPSFSLDIPGVGIHA